METEQITKSGRSPRYSGQEKTEILSRYESSGETQQAYCRRTGVALSTLTYWLRQRRRRGEEVTKPRLVEVKLSNPPEKQGVSYRLVYGRAWLEVAPGFDAREVAQLAKIVRDTSVC